MANNIQVYSNPWPKASLLITLLTQEYTAICKQQPARQLSLQHQFHNKIILSFLDLFSNVSWLSFTPLYLPHNNSESTGRPIAHPHPSIQPINLPMYHWQCHCVTYKFLIWRNSWEEVHQFIVRNEVWFPQTFCELVNPYQYIPSNTGNNRYTFISCTVPQRSTR